MIWLLCARIAAAEAPADLFREVQIPDGVDVAADVVDGQWRFAITGQRSRTFSAAPPATDAEREALVALLESLLADLSLPEAPQPARPAPQPRSAPPPAPPEPASPPSPALPAAVPSLGSVSLASPTQVPSIEREPPLLSASAAAVSTVSPALPDKVAVIEPAPPPLPAPTVAVSVVPPAPSAPALPPAARLPLRPWLAVEGLLRPYAAPGVGVALGGALALRPISIGFGAALRPARAIRIAPDASSREVVLDLDAAAGRRVALRAGAGITARDYRQYGELVLRSWTPRAFIGAEPRIEAGRWTLAPGLLLDADLAKISFDGRATWLPLTLRSQIRIELRERPRTEIEDADIRSAAGRTEEDAPQP